MTYRTVLTFPVLPGKTEADIRSIAERFRSDPDAYAESRRRAGVTLERAYWQHTPMGDFVVAYVESDRPAPQVIADQAQSDLDIDRFFRDKVKEVHGVDITQPMPGPPPETVAEWVDTAATQRGRGFAFSAPLIPGQQDRGRAWSRETFASEGMTTSRRALGENVEVVTLLETPQGPVIGVYIEGADPEEANRRFATSGEAFDVDFRNTLKELFPPFINFDEPVPGITEIFDSEALLARA